MTYRYKTTSAVAVAGTTIAHGLGMTPDDVIVLPTIATGAGQTYRYAAHDATNVYLAQGTSATSADVTVQVAHTLTE
jgi:hypothetical protein